MDVYNPVYPGLYYFDTFTFTSLGTSGSRGPDVTKTYANAPWRDGDFYIQDGQQYWTVPATGTYQITAAGAYGTTPGRVISGEVKLNEGQTLQILIGQVPTSNTYAGGGTWIATDKLLMVSSGGDGTGGHTASFSPYGSGLGQNGAGYLTDGLQTNPDFGFIVPSAYIHGGFGNRNIYNLTECGFGGANLIGAGGYTGSPGDGVSGATCYADSSVNKFTDIGASSNSAGYVTVSLVDPMPLKQTWTWYVTRPWSLTNQIVSNGTVVWLESLGLFVSSGNYATIATSHDGSVWTNVINNLPLPSSYSSVYTIQASQTNLIALLPNDGIYTSSDAGSWKRTLSGSFFSLNFTNNIFITSDGSNFYTSHDGITWTTLPTNITPPGSLTYGNNIYIGVQNLLYTSSDLQTWTVVSDSNVVTNSYQFSSLTFGDSTFVAISAPFGNTDFYTFLVTSVNQPGFGMPPYTVTSLTINGSWQLLQAQLGYTVNLGNFVSPTRIGTVTSVSSSSVTVSFASSLIYWYPGFGNGTVLHFTPSNPKNYKIITSTNGSTWFGQSGSVSGFLTYGNGAFIGSNPYTGSSLYSTNKGVTWNTCIGNITVDTGGFTGIYSPRLGYFLFTNGNVFYLSLDGKYIVPTASGIVYSLPVQITCSETLGILAAVSAYSIIISRDGQTWEEVLNFGSSGVVNATITWSPELGTFLAYFCNNNTSNSPWVYISTDGITWTKYILAQELFSSYYLNPSLPPSKPCWSPELGIFTSGEAISRDGINWTWGTSIKGIAACAWSSDLGLFAASNTSASFYSSDGLTWTQSGSQVMTSITWSHELQIFIGVGEQNYTSSPFIIYSSRTGKSWSQVFTYGTYAYGGCVTWSKELNIFVALYRETSPTDLINVFTSSNGTSWSLSNPKLTNKTISDLIWSPYFKNFTMVTVRGQTGMYVSSNAIKA